ncbi:hypothetical protein IW261DRAFT_1524348 [Armillaria novae-zelandiae]|uniref:HMG box domain-containing protein n=1 Tax=Armillaria novae-zelandiae TaxID=153914 RepID=A0AA39TZY7_9AGAR|nr:hypothetical protein IW261DRAFT_1524348 [Armillaria novae-zelandiae]
MSRFVHSHQYSTEHSYDHASQGHQPRQFVFQVVTPPYPEAVPLTPQYIDTPSPSSSSLSDESNSTNDSSHKKDRIPRPPNSYIIFRKDIVAKKLIPKAAEHDSRHLSRIIGEMWNKLPEAEKRYYQQRAEEELQNHKILYPNYVYQPQKRTPKPREVKRNEPADIARSKEIARLLSAGISGADLEEAVKRMPPLPTTSKAQTGAEPLKKKRASRKTPISPPHAQPTIPGVQVWKTEVMPHQLTASIPSMDYHDERHFFSAGASFDPLHLIHSEIPTNGFFDNQNPINEINYGLVMSSGLYDDPRATSAGQFDPMYGYVNDYPCYP